ncbi:MAG TPA: flagellar hook-length control protein FliK [Tepidisphaeraceae bacterium]|nr:flagellar hook-length control protein FliK [Tepidisphaeraceae bacterium]
MSKAISTGSVNIAAPVNAVAASAKRTSTKGAATSKADRKFEDALSRAMPTTRNKPADPQPAKPEKTKQPADSTEATKAATSDEAVATGQADESGELAEAEGQSKPVTRKKARSTKDQGEPAGEAAPEAAAAVVLAAQANPMEAVPAEMVAAEDAEASGVTSSEVEVPASVPFSTQAIGELPVDETAVKLSNTDVQVILDAPMEEVPASAESGVSIEGMNVVEEVETDQPAAKPVTSSMSTPDAEDVAASQVDQEIPAASDDTGATKTEKPAAVDRIDPASNLEQVSEVAEEDQTAGEEERSADTDQEASSENWTSDRDVRGLAGHPATEEQTPVETKPVARMSEGAAAESVAMSVPASPVEHAPKATTPTVQNLTESRFAEINHPKIVTAVQSELLPDGGTMQIRLDPPELGAMQVRVEMRDGVLTASFQTANDDATRLLSHSLHQLRTSLESQGVSVERLHVEQVPREKLAGGMSEDGQQQQAQDQSSQQEQQRREMLQRMWRRLAGDSDPLDLMA